MPEDLTDWARRQAAAAAQTENASRREALRRVEAECAQVQRRRRRLERLMLDDRLEEDEFVRLRRELAEDHARLEEQRHRLAEQAPLLEPLQGALDLLNLAKSRFQDGNSQVRREIVKNVFSNLRLRDGKLLCTANEPYRTLAKSRDLPKSCALRDSNP